MVLNPSTPVATLDDVLDLVDFVLIMSVNPGFGGQKFIPRALDKVRALDRDQARAGLEFPIEIDGGVTTGQSGRHGPRRLRLGGGGRDRVRRSGPGCARRRDASALPRGATSVSCVMPSNGDEVYA